MKLILGDSLQKLKDLPTATVDCCVTDPPYGLSKEPDIAEVMQHWINGDTYSHGSKGFMGKTWDSFVPGPEVWRECYRVLKPGAHIAVFAGTRTWDLMSASLRFAGFQNRDTIASFGGPPGVAWAYGSGFPKSLNVYKAAQKAGLVCECEVNSFDVCGEDLRNMPSEMDTDDAVPSGAQQDVFEGVPKSNRKQRRGSVKVARGESQEVAANGAQSSVEGRGDVQAQQGQLHRPEVREMPQSILGDEPQGRLCDGTSVSDGSTLESDANANRGCASQGPRHAQQPLEQSGAISKQPSAQTCRGCGKTIVDKGLGSALKPAWEVILLFRKPFDGPLYSNVLKWGTGALNIDASRIGTTVETWPASRTQYDVSGFQTGGGKGKATTSTGAAPAGRWPANVLFDEQAAALLDEQSGILKQGVAGNKSRPFGDGNILGTAKEFKPNNSTTYECEKPSGASRFFYCAKSSKSERNAGLEGMPEKMSEVDGAILNRDMSDNPNTKGRKANPIDCITQNKSKATGGNFHPTVKPVKLMEYLITLVCPPCGIVLDPFMGSGSTGVAAKRLGREFIGIEREAEYLEIAKRRIES